jgi:hypothetical protein
MRILAPYVLSDPAIDEWQIWLNTNNPEDLAWLRKLGSNAKVRLIEPPSQQPDGIRSINQFWQFCDDPASVYIRLDDDIVWLEKEFFQNLIQNRYMDSRSFLVSAMVINNAMCTYLLQLDGLVKAENYLPAYCMDPMTWKSGEFAEQLHEWALRAIPAGILPRRFGTYPIALCRFSINAICFFGRDIQPILNKIEGDEEEFISCIIPTYLHKANLITTDAWCSHFSFGPQSSHLAGTNILDRYNRIMLERFAGTEWLEAIPPV